MKRENFDHGCPEETWEAARAEARDAMVAVAARRRLIAYSDLVAEIRSLDLQPQSDHLAHMLGEISMAEHEAGRGLLTVVVVHKHGDQMPGPGFFELARSLGHNTKDREAFWIGELEKVYGAWSTDRKAERTTCQRSVIGRGGDVNGVRLAICCADIGSIKNDNFGWAVVCGERQRLGKTIDGLVEEVVGCLAAGVKVALGFECPLWVPVPDDPSGLTAGRVVDGNKPWSAGAGASAMAAGLTETAWILREIRRGLRDKGASLPSTYLDWTGFADADAGVFLWEAFVTGEAKATIVAADAADTSGNAADALIACKEFAARQPNPAADSDGEPSHSVRSLIGAAVLWSGWSRDLALLGAKCLVVKPAGPTT